MRLSLSSPIIRLPQLWRPMFNVLGKKRPEEMSEICRYEREMLSYVIGISEEEVTSNINNIVEEKFHSMDDALVMEANSHQPKINKVPLVLSENNFSKRYYKPRMISLGPYHHGSSNLGEMEKLKPKVTKKFIQQFDLSKEVVYSKIKREINDLREFYEVEAVKRFDDDALSWMFFVDGCTILHNIYCIAQGSTSTFKELNIKVDCLIFLQQDLFLLENQIPYRVLKLLISCLDNLEKLNMKKSIEKFIFDSIKASGEKYDPQKHQLYQGHDPAHLLDLLRTGMLQPFEQNQMSCSIVQRQVKSLVEFISEPLEKIRDLIECIGKVFENFPGKQKHALQFFHNIEELNASGIRLRPSSTGCLSDITFNRGTLKLPPVIVDDLTAFKFFNLIAYEMSPNYVNDFGVSSYIAFLDALIDQAQDVKELRDRQILHNALGSDEEVAKLFNEIGTNIVPNPDIYSDVKRDIQTRYNNVWMTWLAQLNHRYFQNPWSVVAFLAATIAIASTITQTVYTVMGYYK